MATITLRSPLKQRVGQDTIELPGATVIEVMQALESTAPEVKGWVLDEQGRIRRHVNVFVNGEPASSDSAVAGTDRIDIIQAITGGAS